MAKARAKMACVAGVPIHPFQNPLSFFELTSKEEMI
jgi:hypothetical protein